MGGSLWLLLCVFIDCYLDRYSQQPVTMIKLSQGFFVIQVTLSFVL